MSPAPPAPTDPLDALARLTSAEIRARLEALDAEQRALRVLLRCVLARERALARRREVTHAS